jgi:predicted AAA+ superfamily ATPase
VRKRGKKWKSKPKRLLNAVTLKKTGEVVKNFIKDENRQSILDLVDWRCNRNRSTAIIGPHGLGKTMLGKEILKQQSDMQLVSPYGTVIEILAQMSGSPIENWKGRNHYLTLLKDHPKKILMDESQDLPRTIWPMFKEVIDAGSVIVLLGKTDLEDLLKKRHPDLLDRFVTATLKPLSQADFKTEFAQFDADAWSVVFGGSKKSTRVIVDLIEDCLLYCEQNSLKAVDADIVKMFIGKEGDE